MTRKRLNYIPTGTHPSLRSALVWRSAIRSGLLSSTSREQENSLYSLIADGQYRDTSLGRDTWKSLIGSEASLQFNSNRKGLNAKSNKQRKCKNQSKARIGFHPLRIF